MNLSQAVMSRKRRRSQDEVIPFLSSGATGTSLLQEIVYLVSQGADPDEIGLMNIDEQLPVLEYPQPGLDIIQVLSSNGMQRRFWVSGVWTYCC